MKKTILALLLLLPMLFAACGSDDDNGQDYTSFQIKSNAKTGTYHNAVAGYKQADGTYKRVAAFGNITPGLLTDKINLSTSATKIEQIEVFFDAVDYEGVYAGTYKLTTIILNENKNNLWKIPHGYTVGTSSVDIESDRHYPIE